MKSKKLSQRNGNTSSLVNATALRALGMRTDLRAGVQPATVPTSGGGGGGGKPPPTK
jgi:hypothetical protein